MCVYVCYCVFFPTFRDSLRLLAHIPHANTHAYAHTPLTLSNTPNNFAPPTSVVLPIRFRRRFCTDKHCDLFETHRPPRPQPVQQLKQIHIVAGHVQKVVVVTRQRGLSRLRRWVRVLLLLVWGALRNRRRIVVVVVVVKLLLRIVVGCLREDFRELVMWCDETVGKIRLRFSGLVTFTCTFWGWKSGLPSRFSSPTGDGGGFDTEKKTSGYQLQFNSQHQ